MIDFFHKAEKLKTVMRHSWLSNGRRESVAEHTWRMGIMALILHPYLKKPVNLEKVFKMLLIHDLPEVYAGDHFVWKGVLKGKEKIERKALLKITQNLPFKNRKEVVGLWEEHEAWKTPESHFVKALDKLEVLLQHYEADIKHLNKKEFGFNLTYGVKYCEFDPFIRSFRKIINELNLEHYKKHKINPKLYK